MSLPPHLYSRRDWLKAGGLAVGGALFAPGALRGSAVSQAVRLSLNENPFGPSPLAIEAIQNDLGGLFRYTTEAEAGALIAQIASLENVSPEQIVLGEILEPMGLKLGLRHGPGTAYIYTVPGYPALVNAAACVGGQVIGVPLNDRLENDLPALAAAVNDRTRVMFLVNPHNPSGTASGAAEFKAFVREVSQRALVIVDEAYLEYTDDFAARSTVGLTRAGENVLVFRTFSKIHALGALPMGYAIAPREIAAYLRKEGLGFHRDLNRLALVAAGASLRDATYIERVRTAVTRERNLWNDELDALKLKHTDSLANFVYFETGRSHDDVVAGLRREGVEVGRAFAPYDRWIRVTFGLPDENRKAREALRKVLLAK